MSLGWIQATDRVVGRAGLFTDTLNRAQRDMLSQSGYDPDAAVFPGLAGPVFNVKAYGAKGDYNGATGTDDSAAFSAAIAAALVIGGKVFVPPGAYYLNAQVVVDMTLKWNRVLIEGYGAEIFSGPAVTASQFKFKLAPQPHGIVIRGLSGNYLNNTTALAFIELSGCSHGVVEDIIVEHYNNPANFASVLLTASTPGDDNTACFWTTIRNLKTRKRVGGGTNAAYDIWLKGAHNATRITDSAFSHCNVAIALTSDGVGTSLANGVVIDGNAFETIDTAAISVVAPSAADYWPPGLRIINNRCESVPTFVSLSATAGSALQHTNPVWISANWCTQGSVTNWLLNPQNCNVTVLESPNSVVSPAGNIIRQNGPFRMKFTNAASHLLLANESGVSNWQVGHLQLGEEALSSMHIFFNTGNGYLMCKQGSAPTSATDGVVIAANGASLPVPGLIITTGGGTIVPGASSFGIRNNANSADNLRMQDAGQAVFRNTVEATGFRVSATNVVGARDTGWVAMTGTTNKATAYDTATVTLAQLAGRVMALQAALTTHGLLGA